MSYGCRPVEASCCPGIRQPPARVKSFPTSCPQHLCPPPPAQAQLSLTPESPRGQHARPPDLAALMCRRPSVRLSVHRRQRLLLGFAGRKDAALSIRGWSRFPWRLPGPGAAGPCPESVFNFTRNGQTAILPSGGRGFRGPRRRVVRSLRGVSCSRPSRPSFYSASPRGHRTPSLFSRPPWPSACLVRLSSDLLFVFRRGVRFSLRLERALCVRGASRVHIRPPRNGGHSRQANKRASLIPDPRCRPRPPLGV